MIAERESLYLGFFDPPCLNRLEESEFINFWGKLFHDRGLAAGLKKSFILNRLA